MQQVDNDAIRRWGSYSDRKNSFDDDADIDALVNMIQYDENMNNYIENIMPTSENYSFSPKHYGAYGVDLTIVDEAGEPIMNIDVERWSQWTDSWPKHYKRLHFLARKDKFLFQEPTFVMAFMSYNQDKVILVEQTDIMKYEPKQKRLGKYMDTVRDMPISVGNVFGDTDSYEESVFN